MALCLGGCVPEAGDQPYLTPFPGEDLATLDRALDEAFREVSSDNARDQALQVLRYVSQRFGSGPPTDYHKTGAAVLEGGPVNLCGDKALLLVALCRRLDLPARVVTFDNFQALPSHIAAEVYFEGGWRFLDPSAGLFFSDVAPGEGGGTIYSRAALKSRPERVADAFFVGDAALWSGTYRPEVEFVPLPAGYKKESWQPYTLPETYQLIFRRAFPHATDRHDPVSFPIRMTLDGADTTWVGELDGASADCNAPAGPDGAPRYYGTHTIGQADLMNSFHTLLLEVPEPGDYRVTYHFLGASPDSAFEPEALADAYVRETGQTERRWFCEFRAQTTHPLLRIENTGAVAVLDAIKLESLPPPRD